MILMPGPRHSCLDYRPNDVRGCVLIERRPIFLLKMKMILKMTQFFFSNLKNRNKTSSAKRCGLALFLRLPSRVLIHKNAARF